MPQKIKKVKKTPPTKLRGMRDIIGYDFYQFQGFFEKAADIAIYYGFKPIRTPILEREEVFSSGVGFETDIIEKEMYTLRVKGSDKLALRPEGTAPIVRAYIENGMQKLPQPVMLYYFGSFFRHNKPQKGRYREFSQFGLEMLGTDKSISDAMIIKITQLILEESGFNNLCILINSIGDDNCRPDYIKELTAYYRKYINSMCPDCRQRIKNNPLRLLDCKNDKCQEFKEEAPEMLNFLCEPCKQHFKEVLEYLDTMDIPYEINHTLVRGIDYYTRTVFEIFDDTKEPEVNIVSVNKDEEKKDENNSSSKAKEEDDAKNEKPQRIIALASGGRYDNLFKKLKSKHEIAAIGVAIGVDRVLEMSKGVSFTPRIIKKPKIYFIQIGYEAKLKSLSVIEVLRKAKIPLVHSLSKNKLSTQLAMAEKAKITLAIIIGQKEALENTVIVRNMNSRSQETIKIEKLVDYLKKKT